MSDHKTGGAKPCATDFSNASTASSCRPSRAARLAEPAPGPAPVRRREHRSLERPHRGLPPPRLVEAHAEVGPQHRAVRLAPEGLLEAAHRSREVVGAEEGDAEEARGVGVARKPAHRLLEVRPRLAVTAVAHELAPEVRQEDRRVGVERGGPSRRGERLLRLLELRSHDREPIPAAGAARVEQRRALQRLRRQLVMPPLVVAPAQRRPRLRVGGPALHGGLEVDELAVLGWRLRPGRVGSGRLRHFLLSRLDSRVELDRLAEQRDRRDAIGRSAARAPRTSDASFA